MDTPWTKARSVRSGEYYGNRFFAIRQFFWSPKKNGLERNSLHYCDVCLWRNKYDKHGLLQVVKGFENLFLTTTGGKEESYETALS